MRKLTKFEKILSMVVMLLVWLVLLLIFLNTFTHPRVLQVNLVGGIDSANIKDQQIRIDFNRPIKKDNIANYISITPEVKFRDLWSASTLILIPNSTLDSQTEYTIKIDKNIQDIYNENFENDFEFKFKTETPKFALVEKQYGSNLNTIAIYNADLTGRQEIFTDNNIKFYGINKNFVVVVTEDNYTNNIKVLNRLTNQTQDFNLNNTRINTFAFSGSQSKNEFIYTKQEVEVKQNYYLPKSLSKVFIYSLDTQSEIEFNPDNTASDVTSLKYSNDGNSILYKTGESFYSLAETKNPSNYTGIGRFLSEGNFNGDGTSIVFVAYDPLNTYTSSEFLTVFDSNRTTNPINTQNIAVLDPQFEHNSNQIIYAERFKELETTKGIYKIMRTDLQGNKFDIISSEDFSLELPQLSADDRYISIEKYSKIVLQDFNNTRSFGFQNKPSSGSIIIFDTLSNKVYDKNLIGIDVKWL